MIITAIAGYSRSGKTTTLAYLKSKGFQVMSASQELDYLTIEHFQLAKNRTEIEYWVSVLRNKRDSEFYNQTGYSCRDGKIYVAEEVIVPTKGRLEGLVIPTIKNQVNSFNKMPIVYETINNKENELFKLAFRLLYNSNKHLKFKSLTLQRAGELIGVDIREPLNGSDTYKNDGSLEDLQTFIDSYFSL